jgi:hypothetical protein
MLSYRAQFYCNVQGHLYSSAQDKKQFSRLISSLKCTQQQLQQGRVVLQHLQRLQLAVASDNVGWTVVQQLLLPVIKQRIDAAAAKQNAMLQSAALALDQLQQLWQQPENAAALHQNKLANVTVASLKQNCELMTELLSALQRFDRHAWARHGNRGLKLLAKLASWLQLLVLKDSSGLLQLHLQASKPADGEVSSSSSSSSSSVSKHRTESVTGSSSEAGASSSRGSAAKQAGHAGLEVDVLVATAWGLCAEVLVLVLESERDRAQGAIIRSIAAETIGCQPGVCSRKTVHKSCSTITWRAVDIASSPTFQTPAAPGLALLTAASF